MSNLLKVDEIVQEARTWLGTPYSQTTLLSIQDSKKTRNNSSTYLY